MNVNETPYAKLKFSKELSVKNSYGEFHDNLKSGLIVVIRCRETDRQMGKEGGREKDHKSIYAFIYHLSSVCYVWIAWPSQSKRKIKKKYKSTNTPQNITQLSVSKSYKNHGNAKNVITQ